MHDLVVRCKFPVCLGGEIGRRTGLKIPCPARDVRVQAPPQALIRGTAITDMGIRDTVAIALRNRAVCLLFIAVAVGACCTLSAQPLFDRLSLDRTGVGFMPDTTTLPKTTLELKFINFMVPGCGVAIGDITGDGRPDLVFTSWSRVEFYRNEGDMRFTNITSTIGIPADSLVYSTGVTIVDINGDGKLDVFLARWQHPCRLLVNKGKGVFSEQAHAYGLDLNEETVHAVFFDYDKDDKLDAYLCVYSDYRQRVEAGQQVSRDSSRLTAAQSRQRGRPDHLYHNNGNNTFSDVTAAAGIRDDGMGLSATAADINLDGYADLYIANDFNIADVIYLNNKNGTFTAVQNSLIRRFSTFSMGCDIADFNNDGLPDIITTDMLPANHVRRITNAGASGDMSIYNPTYDSNQVTRNMLQVNRGANVFSDIGYQAGVAATDWSWACLMADFDNDGRKDIFIANGYMDDISNQDYVYNVGRVTTTMPKPNFLREPNFMFRNDGDLTFTDVSKQWGIADTSASKGAAYADLDNDGDLDLVVANLDREPYIYHNTSVERGSPKAIRIQLKGTKGNPAGIGTKIRVVSGTTRQYLEQYPVRGYQSSVDATLLVAARGNDVPTRSSAITDQVTTMADTVFVEWPDGRTDVRTRVAGGTLLTFDHAKGRKAGGSTFALALDARPIFTSITATSGLAYTHRENYFDDFKRYRLMPTRTSWGGPAVAVGDINADKLDDVVYGASKGYQLSTFIQSSSLNTDTTQRSSKNTTPGSNSNTGFRPLAQPRLAADSVYEDQALLLVDIDGDGDRDLVVAGGGAEYDIDAPERGVRTYLNDGAGMFSPGPLTPSRVRTNATTLNACDFDRDGDVDLFVGGGVETDQYPLAAASYLLENDGKGRFTDVTDARIPGVKRIGMVRSALWTDIDADGAFDLIVAGEWMPLTVFRNIGGRFVNSTTECGLDSTSGWWYSLNGADIDNDGDVDYVAGNMGLNTRYQARPSSPIELYSGDFDDNGSTDALIVYTSDGKRRLVRDRPKIFAQMPTLNRRFNEYKQFASATIEDILDRGQLETSTHKVATEMRSSILLNDGKGHFTVKPLPDLCQISPVLGVEFLDVNSDNDIDLVLCGNVYGAEDDVVRYDAGKGLVLLGDGLGGFSPLSLPAGGFISPYDTRGLVTIKNPGNAKTPIILATSVNNGISESFILSEPSYVRVIEADPTRVTHAMVELGGRSRRVEIYCGSGYRSQSSCHLVVPVGAGSVHLFRGSEKK